MAVTKEHGRPDQPPSQRPVTATIAVIIEDNAHGERLTILKNIQMGKCCVIRAHSNVTCEIPACSIAVGNPASPIKKLCHNTLRWLRLDEASFTVCASPNDQYGVQNCRALLWLIS